MSSFGFSGTNAHVVLEQPPLPEPPEVRPPTGRVVTLSAKTPAAVGELAAGLPVSRPAVSQHLRVLTDAGLVTIRREGNRRLYRWRSKGLRDAATFVEEMWSENLARLKVAAEREEWPARARAASSKER